MKLLPLLLLISLPLFAQKNNPKTILSKSDATAAHLIATEGEQLLMDGLIDEIGASIAAMPAKVKASEDGQKAQDLYFSIRKLEIGAQVPDFTAKTPDGKEVNLYSFIKGKKCVLLDFWASWCSWCRKESPNVERVWSAYKGKDFDVISFSFDDNAQRWTDAIKKDNTLWTQVSDLQGANKSKVYKWYDLNGIPAIFLIDGKGRILFSNLRGDAIQRSVEETLNK